MDGTMATTSKGIILEGWEAPVIPTIAFDVDGTLIDFHDRPRPQVIALFRAFQALGYRMLIWSAHGEDYSKEVGQKLGLTDFEVIEKGSIEPDIAVDDDGILAKGKVVIKV